MVRSLAVAFSLLVVCPLFAQGERAISDVRTGIASATDFGSMTGAGGGDEFLAAWTSLDRGGQAVRLDATGRRLDGTSIGLPFEPRFVFRNGETWVVVGDEGWARIDRDGSLLDRVMRPHAQPLGRILGGAWTGAAVVLASYSDRRLLAYSLDGDMNLTASRVLANGVSSGIDVRVAADGQSAVILSDEETLQASLFDRTGAFVRKKQIATDDDVLAAVGSDGERYLVVRYRATVDMTPASYRAFWLDRELRTAEAPTSIGHRGATITHSPTLSWDGDGFSFFYVSPEEVRAARLDANGNRVEDTPLAQLSAAEAEPLAGLYGLSAGGATLFLYAKAPADPGQAYLHARAGHSPDDLADADELPLEFGAMRQDGLTAASGKAVSFVVWRERVAPGALRVYGTRVARDGTILDPHSIPIANNICGSCTPAVTSNGETFLVAWYSTSNAVQAAEYDANGAQKRFWTVTSYQSFRYGAVEGRPDVVVTAVGYYAVVWRFRGIRRLADQYGGGNYFSTFGPDVGEGESRVFGSGNGVGYLLASGNGTTYVASGGRTPLVALAGGNDISGVWWTGSTFSVLHGDASTFNVTRYDRNTPVATVASFARPQYEAWGETTDPECDAKGCLVTFGSIENGRFVLRTLRVEDDGTTASHRVLGVASVPRGHLWNGETMDIAPLQVPGGPVVVAYTRRELEPPSAGVSRVFLRTIEGARTRPVRH